MKKYKKAIASAVSLNVFAIVVSAAAFVFSALVFFMPLLVYKNADDYQIFGGGLAMLCTLALLISSSVLLRRYRKELDDLKTSMDGDLAEQTELCENIVASRHFFFDDRFLSFDRPVLFEYDRLENVYYWRVRGRYDARGTHAYFAAVELADGAVVKLNFPNRDAQEKLLAEFKKYAPKAKIYNKYPKFGRKEKMI